MSEKIEAILVLLNANVVNVDAIERSLNMLTPAERVAAIRLWTPTLQERLFNACEGRKVTVDQIVPASKAGLIPVIHDGQNTLPAHRQFQKRFCRPSSAKAAGGRHVLWGYNHQSLSALTGPGYFVAYDDEATGEVVIDYRELPTEKPESWPAILDNKARLGRFVYAGMVDRLRRVSEHVSIGRAYKSAPMNAWFALVREAT